MIMFFKDDRIGDGQLGDIMMTKFLESALLNAREDSVQMPSHIIFINRGVLICAQDSLNLAHLKGLENLGVKIICCGTCVEFYSLKDKMLVGEIGNAKDIMKLLSQNKVLAL